MRVPAVFWGPGLVKPATISGVGSTLDMMATITTLTGIDAPPVNDGMDLSPVLLQGEGATREVMPYYAKGELSALRKGDIKIHLRDPDTGKALDTPKLFDLHRDVGEQHDIAVEQPGLLAAMQQAAADYAASIPVKPPLFDARLME